MSHHLVLRQGQHRFTQLLKPQGGERMLQGCRIQPYLHAAPSEPAQGTQCYPPMSPASPRPRVTAVSHRVTLPGLLETAASRNTTWQVNPPELKPAICKGRAPAWIPYKSSKSTHRFQNLAVFLFIQDLCSQIRMHLSEIRTGAVSCRMGPH